MLKELECGALHFSTKDGIIQCWNQKFFLDFRVHSQLKCTFRRAWDCSSHFSEWKCKIPYISNFSRRRTIFTVFLLMAIDQWIIKLAILYAIHVCVQIVYRNGSTKTASMKCLKLSILCASKLMWTHMYIHVYTYITLEYHQDWNTTKTRPTIPGPSIAGPSGLNRYVACTFLISVHVWTLKCIHFSQRFIYITCTFKYMYVAAKIYMYVYTCIHVYTCRATVLCIK